MNEGLKEKIENSLERDSKSQFFWIDFSQESNTCQIVKFKPFYNRAILKTGYPCVFLFQVFFSLDF